MDRDAADPARGYEGLDPHQSQTDVKRWWHRFDGCPWLALRSIVHDRIAEMYIHGQSTRYEMLDGSFQSVLMR